MRIEFSELFNSLKLRLLHVIALERPDDQFYWEQYPWANAVPICSPMYRESHDVGNVECLSPLYYGSSIVRKTHLQLM